MWETSLEKIHIHVEILKHKGRYKMGANNPIVGWWHCPLSAWGGAGQLLKEVWRREGAQWLTYWLVQWSHSYRDTPWTHDMHTHTHTHIHTKYIMWCLLYMTAKAKLAILHRNSCRQSTSWSHPSVSKIFMGSNLESKINEVKLTSAIVNRRIDSNVYSDALIRQS